MKIGLSSAAYYGQLETDEAAAHIAELPLDTCEVFLETPSEYTVMGCVVNGPGEAREADIGIAGGDGCAMLFRKGTVLRKVAEEDIVPELMAEIEKL